jgi:hypothetical protein
MYNMNKINFRNLIRELLLEEIDKRRFVETPIENSNNVNNKAGEKTFSSDPNTRDTMSKRELLANLKAVVKKINPKYKVVWNDHDDIVIDGKDIVYVRISPKWEDNYRIEFYVKSEDRFIFNGLTWEQVIEFVKENLEQPTVHTYVEKARDRSWRNSEDQSTSEKNGLPQKNKPVPKKVGTEKNKEKNYSVLAVENEDDLPDKPFKEVADIKRQVQHTVKDPVRLRKRKPDTKLKA